MSSFLSFFSFFGLRKGLMFYGVEELETIMLAPSLASSKSDLIPRLMCEGEIVFFLCAKHTSLATSKISAAMYSRTHAIKTDADLPILSAYILCFIYL